MNDLQKFIQSIPIDKKDHVILGEIVGFTLTMSTMLFFAFVGSFFNITLLMAVIGANLGGAWAIGFFAWKEMYIDKYKKLGTPEWWDFIASSLPVLAYLILINTIYFL
jgi:hypothetical protein